MAFLLHFQLYFKNNNKIHKMYIYLNVFIQYNNNKELVNKINMILIQYIT